MKKDDVEYELLTLEYSGSVKKLMNKYDMEKDNTLLSLFMFNLVKFSFSKDILVAYNNKAAGYHFNTDISVSDYLDDFNSVYEKLETYADKKFECEILFTTQEYNKDDYSLSFPMIKRGLK